MEITLEKAREEAFMVTQMDKEEKKRKVESSESGFSDIIDLIKRSQTVVLKLMKILK